MKLNEYQSQDHYLTLAKIYSDFKIKSRFSQKLLSYFEPNFIGKLMGEWACKIIQISRVT